MPCSQNGCRQEPLKLEADKQVNNHNTKMMLTVLQISITNNPHTHIQTELEVIDYDVYEQMKADEQRKAKENLRTQKQQQQLQNQLSPVGMVSSPNSTASTPATG